MGYPNCVVYAEAGTLTMRDCRITCGGAAPSAAHAMQVFNHTCTLHICVCVWARRSSITGLQLSLSMAMGC